MAIAPNKYYPRQMNGPIISATGNANCQEFEWARKIQEYLRELSIDTAQETELENIGRVIGYIRPLVPEGFNSENIMLLGTLPLEQDPDIGLAEVGVEYGGELSSVAGTETGFMSLGTYRKFLKSMAVLKRYGITLSSIDKVVSVIDTDYTISYDENKDILVNFTNNIGYKNIWILTQLFYRIATAPQVLITSGN